MDKLVYISRQFHRAEYKKFEHYVITRIWHLLNDLDIKFVTQQYVTRPNGCALTDMYFPQFHLHIEIDEAQHFEGDKNQEQKQVERDKVREQDIINATNHEILRVDVTQNIEKINKKIDEIVEKIKEKKLIAKDFQPWNIEKEQSSQTYIDLGYIDLKDDVAFRTEADAASCFGKFYKGLQKGGIKHPKEDGKMIWFPKLYPNGVWSNSISDNEEEIREVCELLEIRKTHYDAVVKSMFYKRIVFARVKGPLGDIMYRFKGEYEFDQKASSKKEAIYRRISKKVKTYPVDCSVL